MTDGFIERIRAYAKEDAHFAHFQEFRETFQAADPDPEKWRRAQIKWAHITSQGLAHPVAVQRIHQPHAGSKDPYLSAKDCREWHLDGDGMLEELLTEL